MAVLSTSASIATPGLPVGSIQAFAGANAPTGWLLCDGSEVGRASYPDLFNTIGTIYGAGNTTTTFNLPDLRGRVPAGKDNMGGTAAGRLTTAVSGIAGTALGTAGGSQNIPDHSHQSYIRLFEYFNDAILGQSGATGAGGYNARTGTWTTWVHPTTTIGGVTVNDYTGRSTPASTWVSQTNMISEGPSYQQTPQNVQPTLVVNYIVKAVADIARGGWYTQSSPPVVTQLPTNPAIGEEVYLYSASPIEGYQQQRWDGSAWSILSDSRWQGTSASNFLSAVSSTTLTGSFGSNIIYTNASITLTPGTWLVQSQLCLYNTTTADNAACSIYNRTTSTEVSSSRGPSFFTSTAVAGAGSSIQTRMIVTSNTQVCPFGSRNGGSTIQAVSYSGAPAGTITAIRLFYS